MIEAFDLPTFVLVIVDDLKRKKGSPYLLGRYSEESRKYTIYETNKDTNKSKSKTPNQVLQLDIRDNISDVLPKVIDLISTEIVEKTFTGNKVVSEVYLARNILRLCVEPGSVDGSELCKDYLSQLIALRLSEAGKHSLFEGSVTIGKSKVSFDHRDTCRMFCKGKGLSDELQKYEFVWHEILNVKNN